MSLFPLSFIGVSKSLPTTAYIKMIDVWMIFTMMYPFCVVTLYSVMQLFEDEEIDTITPVGPKKTEWRRKITIMTVTFMLDYGLPALGTIFIIVFWMLGFINSVVASAALKKTC